MNSTYQKLRLRQISASLAPFGAAQSIQRPQRGWLRATRRALGMSAAEVAAAMGTSRQLPLQLEKAEESDAITLRSLRNAANAMGCQLVYALVPNSGTFEELAENRLSQKVRGHVLRAEHSMALESQAVGHVENAIKDEVTRRRKKAEIA